MRYFLVFASALALVACSADPTGANASNTAASEATSVPITNATNVSAAPADHASNASEPKRVPAPATSPPASKPDPFPPLTAYRAVGTEPFWAATIKGGRLTLEQAGLPTRHFDVEVSGKEPATRVNGLGISLGIAAGPCSDGMSDAVYADTVQIALADAILKGCGGARRQGEP